MTETLYRSSGFRGHAYEFEIEDAKNLAIQLMSRLEGLVEKPRGRCRLRGTVSVASTEEIEGHTITTFVVDDVSRVFLDEQAYDVVDDAEPFFIDLRWVTRMTRI